MPPILANVKGFSQSGGKIYKEPHTLCVTEGWRPLCFASERMDSVEPGSKSGSLLRDGGLWET